MYGGATRVSANRTMAWTVSNLVRGKPRPEIESIEPLLGVLASLLSSQVRRSLTIPHSLSLNDLHICVSSKLYIIIVRHS